MVDSNNVLIGIVTNRDLRFVQDMERSIEEVMTVENIITTGKNTGLAEAAMIEANPDDPGKEAYRLQVYSFHFHHPLFQEDRQEFLQE